MRACAGESKELIEETISGMIPPKKLPWLSAVDAVRVLEKQDSSWAAKRKNHKIRKNAE